MRGLLLALAGQILLSAAPLLAQPQPSTGQLLPGLIQAKPPLQYSNRASRTINSIPPSR